MKQTSTTLEEIEKFMVPFQKQAASESYQDSSQNDVVSNEKKVATDKQTNLGLEQSGDAKDGGSTVEDESDNSDELSKTPQDNQGTIKMDIDEPVVGNGNIGKIVHQEVGTNQKTASIDDVARLEKVANALLPMLAGELEQPTETLKEASIEKTAMDLQVEAATDEFAQWFRLGMQKRAADEAELSQNEKYASQIEAHGGASALLDKLAMESPEALIPAEALDVEGEVGEEPAAEMPLEEGGADAELEQLAAFLAEQGVTAEDLEAAIADEQQLADAGVEAPELAGAIGGEDLPAEEGEVEKVATEVNERAQAIRDFIFRQK